MKLLILSKSDIEALLSMPTCIELMENALASLARGKVVLPLRPVLRIPDSRNVFALMPSYSAELKAIGTKFITVFPDNHGSEFDSHQGAVILIDGERGNLLALMDAASITAIRTAAVSGVATNLLARRNVTTLAILGSGVQARTHSDAMLAVRPFKKVLVWSRNPDHAKALVASVEKRGVEFEVARDAEAAVRSADVVCTVTASPQPVLHGKWLSPGAHVNAVGASLPTTRELDSEAVRIADVWVDRRESALNEAGDLLIPIKEGVISTDHIRGEIGDLLGRHGHGRKNGNEITIFKSLGLAIEDLACAHYLHGRALNDRLGTWVEL